MTLKVPKNIIVTSKYTSGKEYVVKSSSTEYKGYYYEMNGKTFAGKQFDINAPELEKVTSSNLNLLLLRASTFLYGKLSNRSIPIDPIKPQSYIFNPTKEDYDKGFATRYFYKKINISPSVFKEISKETFDEFKTNSLYLTTSLKYIFGASADQNKYDSVELEQAERKMPGIKAFLETQ